MRYWAVVLSGCGTVLDAVVLALFYTPVASKFDLLVVLIFPVAVVSLGSAFFILNGYRLGRHLEMESVGEAFAALPAWAFIGLALMLPAAVAQGLLTGSRMHTELDFDRTFAGWMVWISAVGTALHYGIRAPARQRASRVVPVVLVGTAVAAVVLLAVSSSVDVPDPIDDSPALDARLAAQFDGETWHRHLVASVREHGQLMIYLDTTDPGLQVDACIDLRPYADGKPTKVYYADGKHGRFSRTC